MIKISIQVTFLVLFVFLKYAQPLKVLSYDPNIMEQSDSDSRQSDIKIQRRILEILANVKSFLVEGGKRRKFYDILRQEGQNHDNPVPLEAGLETSPVNAEHQALVEHELEELIEDPRPLSMHKTHVEKLGRNDFLVMEDDHGDPFVTVVPNDIYYNVEKKCANWMQDCSLKGIRERLLEKVRGPYK